MERVQKEVYNGKNYSEEFKRKAVQIFYEDNSGRAVGRLLKIDKYTVYSRISKLNEKIGKDY